MSSPASVRNRLRRMSLREGGSQTGNHGYPGLRRAQPLGATFTIQGFDQREIEVLRVDKHRGHKRRIRVSLHRRLEINSRVLAGKSMIRIALQRKQRLR